MQYNNPKHLHEENFARWHRFYKKGLISRRTLLQAAMVAAGSVSLSSILAGCGSDDDEGGATATTGGGGGAAPTATQASGGATATSGGGQAQATATTGGGGATAGGTLRVALSESDMPTMDPHMHLLRQGIILFYHTHDNLGVRNLSNNQIEPWLAESWEVLEPTKWEMKLRQDVKFHNGDPFTAETVKWNWERITNPDQKAPQIGNHSQIAGVDVIDEFTVHVNTKEPYPIFTERLQNFQMIPEKLAQAEGDAYLAENAIGSGPYKFVEWKKGQEIVLEKNPDYWNPDVNAAFEGLVLRIIPGIPTQLAELLAGNLDIIRVIPFDQMSAVQNSGIAVPKTQKILRVGFIGLDCDGRTGENPFMDKNVRNAANHAVDIQGYIDSLQPGGDRTPALLNPMHWGFDESIQPHEYDPDKAKALLEEAGYADGFDALWNRGPSSMPNQDQVDQAIQRDLAAVGINAEFATVSDNNVAVSKVTEGNAGPMWNWNWGSYSVFDADGIYWDMFHPDEIYSYWSNDEFIEQIEIGRGEIDPEVRQAAYTKAQQIVRDEAPVIFEWGFHSMWGVNTGVDWTPAVDEIDRYFTAKPTG